MHRRMASACEAIGNAILQEIDASNKNGIQIPFFIRTIQRKLNGSEMAKEETYGVHGV